VVFVQFNATHVFCVSLQMSLLSLQRVVPHWQANALAPLVEMQLATALHVLVAMLHREPALHRAVPQVHWSVLGAVELVFSHKFG